MLPTYYRNGGLKSVAKTAELCSEKVRQIFTDKYAGAASFSWDARTKQCLWASWPSTSAKCGSWLRRRANHYDLVFDLPETAPEDDELDDDPNDELDAPTEAPTAAPTDAPTTPPEDDTEEGEDEETEEE